MRRLVLLRHAKTERIEPGGSDRDRKLTRRGRADAPAMGLHMARRGFVPALVLVSPAARAEETWTLLAKPLGGKPRVIKDERIYNASAGTLFNLVRETRGAPVLLLVGHNPGLRDLAKLLVAAGEPAARASLADKLPTCGLVVVDLPLDEWSRLAPQSGRLEHFATPHSIGATDE